MSFKIASLCVREDELFILDWLRERAKLDGVSTSELIRKAVKEYMTHHAEPNPQTPLFPNMEPWKVPVVEKRRENLEWLVDTIRKNPGVREERLAARFSEATGLRMETIRDYVRTLVMSHAIHRNGGALYVTERKPETGSAKIDGVDR